MHENSNGLREGGRENGSRRGMNLSINFLLIEQKKEGKNKGRKEETVKLTSLFCFQMDSIRHNRSF